MNNIRLNLQNDSFLLVFLIIAAAFLISTIPLFKKYYDRHKSFKYVPTKTRYLAYASIALICGILLYGSREYSSPASEELAIVIGNTRNSPAPKMNAEIQDLVVRTLLINKGVEATDLQEKIKIFSATKTPYLIELDYKKLGLQSIGNNPSNAKRNAQINSKIISEYIVKQKPNMNGADYFGAILEAKDNIKRGSKIIVIGSGLSDTGDLNFSKSTILTNKEARDNKIRDIKNKYTPEDLDGYTVEFYGLGNTTLPQVALGTKQKDIVRNIYSTVIKSLGGTVSIKTSTLSGDSVSTEYAVGETDTGCGTTNLIFNENDSIKFSPETANFVNAEAANQSLSTVKNIWDQSTGAVQSINVDGYIFKAQGADPNSSLSQERADAVKNKLIALGIPGDKIISTGRGFGPYNKDPDDRMVIIKINRNNEDCQ